MITIILVILAAAIGYTSPFVIRKAEAELLVSVSEINQDENHHPGITLSVIVSAVPSCIVYFFTNNVYLTISIFIMGTCVYFDVKRKWIPDLTLYALLFSAILSISDINQNIESILLSFVCICTPFWILNISGLLSKTNSIYIAAGDIYFTLPLAILVNDYITGFAISMISLLISATYCVVLKRQQIAFLPFLFITYLATESIMFLLK